MNSLAVAELVKNKQYRIHSEGGCKEMETTVFRTFYGVNNDGQALFYDTMMDCPVVYDTRYWTFYSI
jgi:hypothetical protein